VSGGVPHPEYTLAGPGLWAIFGALALVAVFALLVLVSVVRRPDRFTGPVSRMLWGLPQAAYIAAFAWGILARAAGLSPRAILVTLPVAVLAQIAYVLWVVSPKQARVQAAQPDEDASQEPRSL
jgi:hypothetical protein